MKAIWLLASLALTLLTCGFSAGQSSFRSMDGLDPVPTASSQAPTRMSKQPNFSIPFDVANTNVAEVQLYVSNDFGRNWKLYQTQNASGEAFHFRAASDGEYWFAVQTVTRRGAATQQARHQAELKVVVDTRLPSLQLQVKGSQDGRASGEWIAQDPNLAAHTFQLQYQTPAGQWRDVQVKTPSEDEWQQEWHEFAQWYLPPHDAPLQVRASIEDRAGNVTVVNQQIGGGALAQDSNPSRVATRTQNQNAFSHADDGYHDGFREDPREQASDLARVQPRQQPEWLSRGSGLKSRVSSSGSARDPNRRGRETMNVVSHSAQSQRGQDLFRQDRSQQNARDRFAGSASVRRSDLGADSLPARSSVQSPVANRYGQATGQANGNTPSAGYQQTANQAATQPRPRITASPNFALEYDVYNVGNQGARMVELWVTSDRGASWQLYGQDADQQSPMEVRLEQEGYYGFRLVVDGFENPASPSPQAGDRPDIAVVVDWTKPRAKILRANYDEYRRDLTIEWQADDALLAEQPITLSYAQTPQGPWTSFAKQLANSGTYRWQLEGPPPASLFLQMEVSDLAGNVTASQYDVTSGTSGDKPMGRIIDLRPLSQDNRRY